jgi:FkbM family methyltransferase
MNEALLEIMRRSNSYEEADFLPTVFGKFRDEALGGAVPVVLFGAGSAGRELCPILKLHGVDPVCFCDNNPSRTGELYCGLPVISVPELRNKHKESLILVTTGVYRDQVKQQLVDSGHTEERILTISNQEAMCYYTHLAQWYWTQDDLILHENQLLKVYNLLSDQRSREIFASRIALFVHGADYQSFRDFISNFSDVRHTQGSNFQECMNSTNYDTEAYLQFNNDVIHLSNNEVFIDGGAFNGDSTLEFINACARLDLTYRKIICFEPDPQIFNELQRTTAQYSALVLRPLGLWSTSSTIRFAGSNILRPGSTRILSESENLTACTSGITEISTTSIDEEFSDEPVTLIKMDVEGAELEALQGAINTIKTCRPKLIISVYHKRNDLFEIPLLINEMAPGYKLYLRHFSTNFGETTLFAIP